MAREEEIYFLYWCLQSETCRCCSMQLILYKDDRFRLIKACCDVWCQWREDEEAGETDLTPGCPQNRTLPVTFQSNSSVSNQQSFLSLILCFSLCVFPHFPQLTHSSNASLKMDQIRAVETDAGEADIKGRKNRKRSRLTRGAQKQRKPKRPGDRRKP